MMELKILVHSGNDSKVCIIELTDGKIIDIDRVKDAVKAKCERQLQGYDAGDLSVYRGGTALTGILNGEATALDGLSLISTLEEQKKETKEELEQLLQEQLVVAAAQNGIIAIHSTDVSCCKLQEGLLEQHGLLSYNTAAEFCKDNHEVKAILDELESLYDDVEPNFAAQFSCIVAPSGTGKTQLAATAARSTNRVVFYLYTGDTDASTQKFYRPHVELCRTLKAALKNFADSIDINGGASSLLSGAKNEESPLFVLLFKILFDENLLVATLETLRVRFDEERKKNIGFRPLVFLDEVPTRNKLQEFHLVILLRNVLRAMGVCPILMSTHSGVVNGVVHGENSRQDDDAPCWCKAFVKLPPYIGEPDVFKRNPWLIPSERPLVASLMVELDEKVNPTEIVAHLIQKLQAQKPKAWVDDPAMQLCQLFRTNSVDSSTDDVNVIAECKHKVVGTHFGCISLPGGKVATVERGQAEKWMHHRRVQFVVPEEEPFLFLALTTWNMNDVEGNDRPYFPIVAKPGQAISLRKAFDLSSEFFKKPIATGDAVARKTDGDDLEVLALAAVTMATLQSDEGVFKDVKLPQFLSSVYHFLTEEDELDRSRLAKLEKSIRTLLNDDTNPKWSSVAVPTCPCVESSFDGMWNGKVLGAFSPSSGRLKRPADSERRDGAVTGNGGKPFLHIECKNYEGGISTQVLKQMFDRLRYNFEISLFFVSGLSVFFADDGAWASYTQSKAFEEDQLSVLVLSNGECQWLAVEKGKQILSPTNNTTHLVVVVATGVVTPSSEGV